MNSAIELHDSEIIDIELTDGKAFVKFDPAYVHKSAGTPGVDPGEGWVQNAEIIIGDAVVISDSGISGEIWDGHILCDEQRRENVIELPFSFVGETKFFVEFKSGRKLEITGSSIQIRATSSGRYVEAFKA